MIGVKVRRFLSVFVILNDTHQCLVALGDDQPSRKCRTNEWHDHLLARDSAIDNIEIELRERLALVSGAARSALEDELTYLKNNKDRMRYAGLARRGLPLGSGVTESAAKTGHQPACQRRRSALEAARPLRRARRQEHRTERAPARLLGPLLTPLRREHHVRATAETERRVIRGRSTPPDQRRSIGRTSCASTTARGSAALSLRFRRRTAETSGSNPARRERFCGGDRRLDLA